MLATSTAAQEAKMQHPSHRSFGKVYDIGSGACAENVDCMCSKDRVLADGTAEDARGVCMVSHQMQTKSSALFYHKHASGFRFVSLGKKKRKEKITLFSDSNGSLLRRQPRAMTIGHSPKGKGKNPKPKVDLACFVCFCLTSPF